jgi:hypothetical protein
MNETPRERDGRRGHDTAVESFFICYFIGAIGVLVG